MIMEEELIDTSNRIGVTPQEYDRSISSLRRKDEEDNKTIVFEKLSRVSSASKV